MSSNSYDSNEILTCLKNTYLSYDKKTRINSEQKLSSLINQNIIEFITNLLEIFKKELDKNLRLSIILFLKRNIEEKAKSNLISKESLNSLIQIYIKIMVEQNITNKELDNLEETFIILLNNTSYQILLEIINYLKEQISSLPLGSINGLVSILSSLINSSSELKENNKFYSIFNPVMIMAYDILQNLYEKYPKNDLTEYNIEDYIKLNNMFYNIFQLFFNSNITAKKILDKINLEEDIIKVLDKVYLIGIKLLVDINAKDNNRIISWTGQSTLDKNLNKMKITIFKYINLRLNKINEYNLDKATIENHNQMIKIIFANLEWIILNKYSYIIKIDSSNLDNEYPDYNYTLLISFMFIYLKRILTKNIFINEFSSQFNLMFKNILLPLLIISDNEEIIANDNELVNDYLIDMNDILYDNKQKKIKSQIAGLIKKFYEKNLNINSYMIKYTINLIYFLFEETRNLFNKDLVNENDIIILLIKTYNKEKIITMLFLVLNIFSGNEKINIDQNYDLLDNVFKSTFPLLENNYNIYPLLKHQIIIFIGNYSIKLYFDDSLILEKTIKYLYECLFNTQYLLISNSAADAIQKIFEVNLEKSEDNFEEDEEENFKSNNIRYILINIASSISNEFEKQILETQISNFFDVLSQIILSFEKVENIFFKNIFINICKRIIIEVEKHSKIKFVIKSDKNKTSKELDTLNNHEIIINKCFNIIKILIENKAFVFNNFDLIENSLRPLINFMEDPYKIKFDEDIIYIIYSLIKQRQKVIGLGFNLIKNIYKYIDKCGSLYLEVYQLIDKYLSYGTNQILTNKIWYEGIFNAFISGIKGDNYNKGILYTCMLIQTWVIHCNNLPRDNLNVLIEKIFENINYILESYNITNDINTFVGYVTTIFSGLINYEEIIIENLNKNNSEKALKKWLKIIIKENDVIFEYEIKIIIYSICFIIKKNIFVGENYFLINLGLDLLKCQTRNSKYQMKKNTKNMLSTNFIEDDEEDKEDDNEEEEDVELNEINIILEKTSNPIKELDEFKIFSEMLQYLKNNNNEIYSNWESSLNQEQKDKIIKLISTKRINIHVNENNIQVARRIVSIKRNNHENYQKV